MENLAAPIVVLDPDVAQARRVAGWLRSAGLGRIAVARTCDEALFLIGRQNLQLLIIDEFISVTAEQRLLRHIEQSGHTPGPAMLRLVGAGPANLPADGRAIAAEVAQKPLDAHDIVVRVGIALERPDLVGRMDSGRDQTDANLATARRMQMGLLPAAAALAAVQEQCCVCLSGFCRPGEEVGGDFWGVWHTGRQSFAIALADFAGHGLGAALNTFRLHAILSEAALPRGSPAQMTRLLNRRLHELLQRGQYATMVYAQIDPACRTIEWCSAGGPPPMFVSAQGAVDLDGSGLPLGVKPDVAYGTCQMAVPDAGILCLFSDGLYEGGAGSPDITRAAIAAVLKNPARLAAAGRLAEATQRAIGEMEALRDRFPCVGHSDDVMAVCMAVGPPAIGS